MNSSLKDFEFRKVLALKAYHKIIKCWKSNLANTLNIRIGKVTIETILIYGSETWTINKSWKKGLMDDTPNFLF